MTKEKESFQNFVEQSEEEKNQSKKFVKNKESLFTQLIQLCESHKTSLKKAQTDEKLKKDEIEVYKKEVVF